VAEPESSPPVTSPEILIRAATQADADAIWSIVEPTIRAGETFGLDRDLSRQDGLAFWLRPGQETFVAESQGQVLGVYYLRPNYGGGGGHVCNCGYMTAAASQGRGVARRMGEHSLAHARARGFAAMQFNFVVSSNLRAVALWRSLGFQVVGQSPRAFEHPILGRVDTLVMHREL